MMEEDFILGTILSIIVLAFCTLIRWTSRRK